MKHKKYWTTVLLILVVLVVYFGLLAIINHLYGWQTECIEWEEIRNFSYCKISNCPECVEKYESGWLYVCKTINNPDYVTNVYDCISAYKMGCVVDFELEKVCVKERLVRIK